MPISDPQVRAPRKDIVEAEDSSDEEDDDDGEPTVFQMVRDDANIFLATACLLPYGAL